jgi:general secretion pathway protein H
MKQLNRGYTLIEILVVIFIISLVTSVAVLSIGRNENKQVEAFANQLTQMLSFAEEQAMLQPNVLGLSFNKHSLQFSSLQIEQDGTKQNWIPLNDNVLGKRDFPGDIEIGIQVGNALANNDDQTVKDVPQIIISTNGDFTPFTIYVGRKGKKPLYVISGDENGTVTNKELL